MAADWIKVEKTTSRKPEVLQLSELLQIHIDHAFGLCIRFWSWCDDQLHSCHAPRVTNVTLDAVFGHPGFSDALLKVGWLRVRSDSLEIPNFDRHLSESAKKRALSGERKKRERVEKVSRSERDKSVTRLERDKNKNKTEEKEPGGTPVSVAEPVKKFDPAAVAIPPPLDTPEFRDGWRRWCKHRSEIRQPLRPTMVDGQLRELIAMGVGRAVAAINHTIAKGWTGLREPDAPATKPGAVIDDRQAERERRQRAMIEKLGGGTNADAG